MDSTIQTSATQYSREMEAVTYWKAMVKKYENGEVTIDNYP